MRLILIVLMALNCATYGQTGAWQKLTMEKANSAKEAVYLSTQEKTIIYYINLVRMNPALFEQDYLKKYLVKFGTKPGDENRWIASLKSELKSTRPMNPVMPQKDLYHTARKHAQDMGLSGKSGHKSSKGKSYKDRMKQSAKMYYEFFENCQYGLGDPLHIVIDLLIDDSIDGTEHRRAILNPSVQYIGVSMHPHIVYKHNSVIELGGRLN
ncbi:MAG: hypothetical protein JKX73_07100 [Flavobacteriales bacterium]|nr:hypothetical protein [Flavobacteriales bacterium]